MLAPNFSKKGEILALKFNKKREMLALNFNKKREILLYFPFDKEMIPTKTKQREGKKSIS